MVREKRDTEEPLFLLCLETLQRLYIHRGKKKLTFFFKFRFNALRVWMRIALKGAIQFRCSRKL